jgi:acyl-CoA synthetase (NDP forming)
VKAIALYIEALRDGRRFMDIARQVSRKKPIVVLKGGTTGVSLKASFSHTGSLAGDIRIFEAAIAQSGATNAKSLEQLYDFAKAFSLLPLPEGPNVFIIESSGGAGILACSACEEFGLRLPELKEETKAELRNHLSSMCTFSNPFDLTTEGFNPEKFNLVIKEVLEDPRFNAILAIFGDPIQNAAESMRSIVSQTKKPLLVSYLGGGETEIAERTKMHSFGIPVFPTPERAIEALNALVNYSVKRSKKQAN